MRILIPSNIAFLNKGFYLFHSLNNGTINFQKSGISKEGVFQIVPKTKKKTEFTTQPTNACYKALCDFEIKIQAQYAKAQHESKNPWNPAGSKKEKINAPDQGSAVPNWSVQDVIIAT